MSPQISIGPLQKVRVPSSGVFSADQRIRKHSEFQKIQSSASRVVSPGFVFLAVASADPSEKSRPARLGITASRRVGCAVVRNRAKRLVREAFRATRDLWPDEIDLVVIVRHSTQSRSLAEIVLEWRRADRKLKRLWARLQSVQVSPAPVLEPRP